MLTMRTSGGPLPHSSQRARRLAITAMCDSMHDLTTPHGSVYNAQTLESNMRCSIFLFFVLAPLAFASPPHDVHDSHGGRNIDRVQKEYDRGAGRIVDEQ